MSKTPPEYELAEGDATTITLWWLRHKNTAAKDIAKHRCPPELAHLGEGKVLYHLRQAEAFRQAKRAEALAKRKKQH